MKKLVAMLDLFATRLVCRISLLLALALVFTSCKLVTNVFGFNDDGYSGIFGTKGPGGGYVFFDEGGQRMECSGELGDTTWDQALIIAQNHNGGGFTNWHLPTRSELDLIYKNLKKNNLGGISNSSYWTSESSVNNNSYAYYQNFSSGYLSTTTKGTSNNVRAVRSYSTANETVTSLTIKNQSFTEIADVLWQGVSFANSQYENSIKSGTNVNQPVAEGGGYIFFRRRSSPIIARTSEIVIINKGESKEFTFTDNTLVVEVNNPGNTGTLGSLKTTVVWFDDAEGDLQPYYESQSFVGYYKDGSDLPIGNYRYIHTPKNGSKSIAVGGTNTALLHVRVNLEKKAKLSFWYANKAYGGTGTLFSINGVEKNKWIVDVNWSRIELELEPGVNDLVWEKKDGHSSYNNYSYFSLDDILIYYTE